MVTVKFLQMMLAITLPMQLFCQSEPSSENSVVELNADGFAQAIAENHFVMFYAPWCSHCEKFKPAWEDLAKIMNVEGERTLTMAKVDCMQNGALCQEHSITSYPTLLLFKKDVKESIKFKGTRTKAELASFMNMHVGHVEDFSKRKLITLTEDSFDQHIASGHHFVKFYAPWCGHCQRLAPVWDDLAESLSTDLQVTIAKVDCTIHRSVCTKHEVKGYPTLLWFKNGQKVDKYSGERELPNLKEYIGKMLGEISKPETPVGPDESVRTLQLNGDSFWPTVGTGLTFVKFYAPWCGHCKKLSPTWDQLAEKMFTINKDIKIAKVDCTAADNKDICASQNIEAYPTLYAYKNGGKEEEYVGGRALENLVNYVSKLDVHDEL